MFGEKTVHILYTKITREVPAEEINRYLLYLPEALRAQHFRYRRWQDRASNLFSKILLARGLEKFGGSHKNLEILQYTEFGRPYLSGDIDFNISHSGQYVLCAIAQQMKVGIDIEEIKKVDFSEFESLMTNGQWEIIKTSRDPLRSFFKFWAIKESIIKADGRGLSIPLKEIIIDADEAYFERKWFLKELSIDAHYCSYVAVDVKNPAIEIQYVDFENNY